MQLRLAAAVAVIVGFQVAAAGSAIADDAPVLIADINKVTLIAKDNGDATASVTLETRTTPT